jgi:hypothetical protein
LRPKGFGSQTRSKSAISGALEKVKRVVTIAMAIGLHFTAPAIAQTPYDGVWNVTVETRTGSCEPSVRYPVTVSDGKISAAGADITGNVGRDGRVRASIRGAFAIGNIDGGSGSGKWSSASAGIACSGKWEASKQ